MSKVYIVTSGEYSDYRIRGVFSDEEKANIASRLYGSCNISVEPWELDDAPSFTVGMCLWGVKMDKNGDTDDKRWGGVEIYDIEEHARRKKNFIEEGVGFDDWEPYGNGDNKHVIFYMQARDEKHAIKIANERRVQLITTNQWTGDFDEWHQTKKKKEIKEKNENCS